MKVIAFVAESPAIALAKIHAQLGPEAIALSVRAVPSSRDSRLWRKKRAVEVLACVPEDSPDHHPTIPSLQPSSDPLLRSLSEPLSQPSLRDTQTRQTPQQRPQSSFHPGANLEATSGYAIMQHALVAPEPDESVTRNTQHAIRPTHHIIPAFGDAPSRPHVFIGPPGAGKTTLLCKWLVSAVLTEKRTVRLWRLDGANANAAEVLDVYAEMFGLNVERFWRSAESQLRANEPAPSPDGNPSAAAADLLLVDLPGVEADDFPAMIALKTQLAALSSPHVHLVLNAAYDLPLLIEQFRAFAAFQPEDISFTHLDEEKRHQKLRDVVAGTSCSIRFLGAGQKIPGEFVLADRLEPSVQEASMNIAISE